MNTSYESGVGSVNWAANNTKPDLSFASNSLASRGTISTQNKSKRLLHCIEYISATLDQNLDYKKSRFTTNKGEFIVATLSDASFVPEVDVESISPVATHLNGNPVKWLIKKQGNITRSTAAAELVVALSIERGPYDAIGQILRKLMVEGDVLKSYEDSYPPRPSKPFLKTLVLTSSTSSRDKLRTFA